MRRTIAWAAPFALAIALANSTHAQQQPFTVKAGVTIAPDTVRIGDPFRVTIGVRAPRGATIEFAKAMDSTASVQSLDPVVTRTSADTTAAEQYADYRVAAWDIGSQPIRIADVIVRFNGAERHIPIAGHSVFVRAFCPLIARNESPSRRGRCSSRLNFHGGCGRFLSRRSSLWDCSSGGGSIAVAGRGRRWSSIRLRAPNRNSSASRRSRCSRPASAGATSR
jgi:hypothetical protein